MALTFGLILFWGLLRSILENANQPNKPYLVEPMCPRGWPADDAHPVSSPDRSPGAQEPGRQIPPTDRRSSVWPVHRPKGTPLTLFLHARMYGCWHETGSSLPKARYFAPHFAKKIANTHPGINVGISYIAKIDQLEVVDNWESFVQATIAVRSKAWFNKHKTEVEALRKHPDWDWSGTKKRTFIYMGAPRLAFSPAVKKESFQKSKGNLSKRYLSFDDLFEAWGC